MVTPYHFQPHIPPSRPLPISAFHYYTPPFASQPVSASQPPPSSTPAIITTPSKLPCETLDLTEDDFYDYTDFVTGGQQEKWSIHNLPEILYQLRPHRNQWHGLISRKKKTPSVQTIKSPWKGEPNLIKFKVLPNRISSNVEIWRVEAWMRLDIRISLHDISMRMNPRFRRSTSSLEDALVQFRKDFMITTWPREWSNTGMFSSPSSSLSTSTGEEEEEEEEEEDEERIPPDLEAIEAELVKKGISPLSNSTRGLTPGLVDPARGDIAGRIPVPEAYVTSTNMPKPITPRKGLTRYQLETGCTNTTPLKRALSNALLIRELSPTPNPPCTTTTTTTTPPAKKISVDADADDTCTVVILSSGEEDNGGEEEEEEENDYEGSIANNSQRKRRTYSRATSSPGSPTPNGPEGEEQKKRRRSPTPYIAAAAAAATATTATTTPSVADSPKPKTCRTTAKSFRAAKRNIPINFNNPLKARRGSWDVSAASPPPTFLPPPPPPAVVDVELADPPPFPTPPPSYATTNTPHNPSTPPPKASSYSTTATEAAAAAATGTTTTPKAPPLAALKHAAAAVRAAVLSHPARQENWQDINVALETVEELRRELVEFAKEGLMVQRWAIDERLEELVVKYGGGGKGAGAGRVTGKGGR